MNEINGYVHLALSCLYCMATKEDRPKEQIELIADTMQTVLDMAKKLRGVITNDRTGNRN